MEIVTAISFGVGVGGVLFGFLCWWHLRRWATIFRYARIAIAYKRKVRLQAPLEEWALWCNKLRRDRDSHGRVVYLMGGTSVAITGAVPPRSRWRRRRKPRQATPAVREGKWSAKDDTVTSAR